MPDVTVEQVADLARAMTSETLLLMVAPGGEVDPGRCWLLAEMFYLEGVEAVPLHERVKMTALNMIGCRAPDYLAAECLCLVHGCTLPVWLHSEQEEHERGTGT